MRLFVAVELPKKARHAIVALEKKLAPVVSAGGTGLRWSRPDQMHLTLAFIGHVDAARAGIITAACAAPFDGTAFDVVFGGLGVFPPGGAPRVLWLGVSRGADALIRLQRVAAERLAAAGVELEARPYSPHITLARWKFSRAADAHRVRDLKPEPRAIPASVHVVTLFESRQSAVGSVYTPLTSSSLAPAHGHPLQ